MTTRQDLAKYRNTTVSFIPTSSRPNPSLAPCVAYAGGRWRTYAPANAAHAVVRVIIKRNGVIMEGLPCTNLAVA